MADGKLRFAVAVDGSEASDLAFHCALSQTQLHRAAELLIVAVVETGLFAPALDTHVIERKYRKLIAFYSQHCRARAVVSHGVLATASHIGKMLCQVCEHERIDCLVLGRRGLGPVSKILIGSVSSYCLDHAPCSVLLARTSVALEPYRPYWLLNQEQRERIEGMAKTAQAEEEERARRLREDGIKEERHTVSATALQEERERRERLFSVESGTHNEFRKQLNEEIERLREAKAAGSEPSTEGERAAEDLLLVSDRVDDQWVAENEHAIRTFASYNAPADAADSAQ